MAIPVVSELLAGANPGADWYRSVKEAIAYLDGQSGGIGRRNVLTNSHMDVWQRATSFTVPNGGSGAYTADRWLAYRGAAGSTVSRQTGPVGQRYGLRLQRDSGNTSTTALSVEQPVETFTAVTLAGRVCQVRVNMQAGTNLSASGGLVTVTVTTGTGTDENPISGFTGSSVVLAETQVITATATDYTFDLEVADTAKQVSVKVSYTPTGTASTDDWVQINGAQLSVGSMSAFERLSIAETLDECMRYYQKFTPAGAGVTNAATSAFRWTLPLAVVMRSAPTVTFTNASLFDGTATRAYSSTGTTYHTTSQLQADLVVSGGSFTAAGRPAVMIDAGSGSITASAEL